MNRNKQVIKRITEIEKKINPNFDSILRIIEFQKGKHTIIQSTIEDEIGIEFQDLNYLDKLKKGQKQTLAIIDDITNMN